MRPEKNLTRLIEAFAISVAKEPALRLVIVGDGAERPSLEAAAARFGVADKVLFTGYIADPAPVLALFDIFALSSDTEQMPISVLEAMASRLPVAGVDVGDVRHIVSDRNKPLIVDRDAQALADILSTLAGDGVTPICGTVSGRQIAITPKRISPRLKWSAPTRSCFRPDGPAGSDQYPSATCCNESISGSEIMPPSSIRIAWSRFSSENVRLTVSVVSPR